MQNSNKPVSQRPLLHLTMNTGGSRYCCPSEEGADDLKTLVPLVAAGGGQIPKHHPWWFNILPGTGEHSRLYQIFSEDTGSVIVGAVVWGAEDSEATWEVAEKLYLNFTDEMVKRGFPQEMLAHCDMPADVPWLATMYTVGTLNISDISELQWMRGFEIYLAQATLLAN